MEAAVIGPEQTSAPVLVCGADLRKTLGIRRKSDSAPIKEHAVGKTVAEISEEAKRTGWSVRVMRENGKNCLGACDYSPGRINVAVVDGKVAEVIGLG